MLKLTIPFKTPSINHLYGQRGKRRFITKEGRAIKKQIIDLVYEQRGYFSHNKEVLDVHVYIYEDWYCLNGSVARKDIANREKFLIDCIFEALGIDDKYIFMHTLYKMHTLLEEKAEVFIYQYDNKM